jgi:hypothetical protein
VLERFLRAPHLVTLPMRARRGVRLLGDDAVVVVCAGDANGGVAGADVCVNTGRLGACGGRSGVCGLSRSELCAAGREGTSDSRGSSEKPSGSSSMLCRRAGSKRSSALGSGRRLRRTALLSTSRSSIASSLSRFLRRRRRSRGCGGVGGNAKACAPRCDRDEAEDIV